MTRRTTPATTRRGTAALTAGLGLGLLVTGCSGGPDDVRPSPPPTSAASPSVTPSRSAATAPATTPTRKPTRRPSTAAPGKDTSSPQVAVSRAPAVPTSVPATLTSQVVVTVTRVRKVTVGADEPGQVAGDAVAVDLVLRNGSGAAFPVGGLTVNATTADDRALDITTAAPSRQLSGSVAAGGQASGTYVFGLPVGASAEGLRLEVLSNRAQTILQFRA